jgi:small subunit ribosomal protein S9
MNAQVTKKGKAVKKQSYTYAIGRRKSATARVRLFHSPTVPGVEGEIQLVVNGKPAEAYFPGELAKQIFRRPFILTETLQKYSASARVAGSGKNGQLGALVLGIARALAAINENELRAVLKSAKLLTRDPRAKERRKVGKGGSARRSKQSPKR